MGYKSIASVLREKVIGKLLLSVRNASNYVKDSSDLDSIYLNGPDYPQNLTDPSDTEEQTGLPGSLYDDISRVQPEDMRRQGPYPYKDIFFKDREFINIDPSNPIEDVQGNPSDNTTPEGRDEDRDTINYNDGEITKLDI